MANLIIIDQLLESVDLDVEPRFVAKDKCGLICVYSEKPECGICSWFDGGDYTPIGCLKISEFDGKDWTECIYEVPRKTTGKIEKMPEFDRTEASIFHAERLYSVVNEIIDWINDNYKDSK